MMWIAAILAVWTAGFAALNYFAVRKWRDSWELVRWIPTMILAAWCFYLAVLSAPDSHNLWPIELVGMTMLSVIVLAIIAVAYDGRTRWKKRADH